MHNYYSSGKLSSLWNKINNSGVQDLHENQRRTFETGVTLPFNIKIIENV